MQPIRGAGTKNADCTEEFMMKFFQGRNICEIRILCEIRVHFLGAEKSSLSSFNARVTNQFQLRIDPIGSVVECSMENLSLYPV